MTRALFRKQMLEIFSWIYKNRKTGKHRSRAAIIGYIILYLLLFSMIGVIFYVLGLSICSPLAENGFGWLYWCIMGLLALFLCVFGSVFNTYSSLYQAKDNDLLLAMPVPAHLLLLMRLSGVYAMGLVYELIVMVPAVLVWFFHGAVTPVGTVCVLLIPLVLSALILVLSAALGWVVALIAGRLRHRNLMTVLLSIGFFGAYYYVCGHAYLILETIVQNPQSIAGKMKSLAYPLYHMGVAAEGNLRSMAIFTTIAAVLLLVAGMLLNISFFRLVTTNRGQGSGRRRNRREKQCTVGGALLKRELRRFLGSPTYMLNCGLGIVIMLVSAVALLWQQETIREYLAMLPKDMAVLVAVVLIGLLASMNDISAPSVSLEGKQMWMIQSLPVTGKQVLLAKLHLHLWLTMVPASVVTAAVIWVFRLSVVSALCLIAVVGAFIWFMGMVGLAINVKSPNLQWSSEVVPVKQSLGVMVTLFGGWAVVAVLAGMYLLTKQWLTLYGWFVMAAVLLLAAAICLRRWLVTRGAAQFEML